MDFLASFREQKLTKILDSADLNEPNRAINIEKLLKKNKLFKELKKSNDYDNFESFIGYLLRDDAIKPNRAACLVIVLHKILDYQQVGHAIEETVKMPQNNLICLEILTGLIDDRAEEWSLIGFQKNQEINTDQIRSLTISSLHYLVKNYQYLGNLLFSKLKMFDNFGTIASYLTDLTYNLFKDDFFKTFFYSFSGKYKKGDVEENVNEQKIDINIFYKIFSKLKLIFDHFRLFF